MDANTLEPTLSDNDIKTEGESRERALKLLLWLAQVSIGMLFAGLTGGYIVRRVSGSWLKFDLPVQFWISTSIILISSISMNWALQSAKKGNTKALSQAVLTTFLLGIVFITCQILGWTTLVRANIVAMGNQSSASGSYLYILSGLHIAHILGGLAALTVVYIKSLRQKYSPGDYLGVKLCATYWHFLDGLWVYLFVFMLILR